MQANQQLCFLKEKIQEIGSAIFFNLSQSVLKFPTSIVETLKVDDFGFVWFSIQKPKQDLREFDNEFPVRLDFFKKGKNYFLQVEGKAWIVNDPEEMNFLSALDTLPADEGKKLNDMVLVKVKMIKAEYHETGGIERPANNTWWQNAVSNIYTWFRSANGGYRAEVFHPASLN
jgi:general stress protein 26